MKKTIFCKQMFYKNRYLLYQLQEVIFYDGKAKWTNPDGNLRHRFYNSRGSSSETDKNCVNFDFMYEKTVPYYSHVGRRSIAPVVLMKMLLIGYLYGIKPDRRLEEEVSLNLAYRWFCGIDLMDRVLDHSTFSQNSRRRFQEAGIFREIFNKIVLKCIDLGIVSGEIGVADGSFLPTDPGTAAMRQLRQSNAPL